MRNENKRLLIERGEVPERFLEERLVDYIESPTGVCAVFALPELNAVMLLAKDKNVRWEVGTKRAVAQILNRYNDITVFIPVNGVGDVDAVRALLRKRGFGVFGTYCLRRK